MKRLPMLGVLIACICIAVPDQGVYAAPKRHQQAAAKTSVCVNQQAYCHCWNKVEHCMIQQAASKSYNKRKTAWPCLDQLRACIEKGQAVRCSASVGPTK